MYREPAKIIIFLHIIQGNICKYEAPLSSTSIATNAGNYAVWMPLKDIACNPLHRCTVIFEYAVRLYYDHIMTTVYIYVIYTVIYIMTIMTTVMHRNMSATE